MATEVDVLRRRRLKCYVCKNCSYIVVKVDLPEQLDDEDLSVAEASRVMRETAKAMKITHESDFYCTFMPEWKNVIHETTHYCGQICLRKNYEAGYQDIERTWERVDQVYATRWDCKLVPEGVRHRKAA